MITAGWVALGFYILAAVFRGTLAYTMKEHSKDYKAITFFMSGTVILNAIFWLILFLMGLITIIKLIWGG